MLSDIGGVVPESGTLVAFTIFSSGVSSGTNSGINISAASYLDWIYIVCSDNSIFPPSEQSLCAGEVVSDQLAPYSPGSYFLLVPDPGLQSYPSSWILQPIVSNPFEVDFESIFDRSNA